MPTSSSGTTLEIAARAAGQLAAAMAQAVPFVQYRDCAAAVAARELWREVSAWRGLG